MKDYKKTRIDKNQKEIVDGLIDAGYTVIDLASVGESCPDILVGVRGASGVRYNLLIEIKSSFTANEPMHQKEFRKNWKGQATLVYSLNDALAVANKYRKM